METALREVTNLPIDPSPDPKQHPLTHISDLVAVSHPSVDFGACIPGTVHERRLSITLLQSQNTSKIITLTVSCDDPALAELPQYIFGVRKDNNCEYFDQYRFRAVQKGVYNFVIGVKTPPLCEEEAVPGRFSVSMEGASGTIEVALQQTATIPQVVCPKELTNQEGLRVLKVGVIRSKNKKETKITFRSYPENLSYTLYSELLGGDQKGTGTVQVKPRVVQVLQARGGFILSISAAAPQSSVAQVLRRVLVLRVKDTNIHYHFPLEVTCYPTSTPSSE